MIPTCEDSILSLFTSCTFLDTLPFEHSKGRFAGAALAPPEVFEGTYIRDAEEHELGLFSTHDNDINDTGYGGEGSSTQAAHEDRTRHRRSLLGRSTGVGGSTSRSNYHAEALNDGNQNAHGAWSFAKRRGPARIGAPEKATPLKKRRAPTQNNKVIDPEAYLLAARKLLRTYPMQRASEHVELMYSQYEGLMDAIADLEETMQQAPPRMSAGTDEATSPVAHEEDVPSLEAAIRREELEILALKEARKELDKETKKLAGRSGIASTTQSRPARALPPRNAPQPLKLPSVKDAQKRAAGNPTASSQRGQSVIEGSSKRVPSVVARRMAEHKAATSTLPTSPDKGKASADVPSLNIEAPSNASIAQEDVEDDDRTIVFDPKSRPLITASEQEDEARSSQHRESRELEPLQSKRALQHRIPIVQLDKILSKIVSAMPGGSKKSVPKDADSVLTALAGIISGFNDSTPSPASSTSRSSVTASPSASLSPVNIIEFQLLHTFLSLLVSFDPLESEDEMNKPPTLVLRDIPGQNATAREALLNMNNLKAYLGGKAKERGWNADLGHKAIWGLVAKRLLHIDRKSSRDTLIGFTS